MSWFQRLLITTIALTFILVVIGGAVRSTDSGLGCPDWPTCHGRLIPEAEKHTLIEFSHRSAAAIVGVVFLGVTYFTFKDERTNRLVFWLTFSAGVLLLAQIILGGVTVKQELPPEIVAAHLATAMAFMGVMIVTATVSIFRDRGTRAEPGASRRPFTRMAIAMTAAAFATLVLGSYISDTSASVACSGWPLCNGKLVPGGDSAAGLHYLHRLLALLLGILIAAVVYLAFEERRRQPLLVGLAIAAAAAFLAQALVGAANIWTDLAAGVVTLHLALAALLWCTTVTIAACSYYLRGSEPAKDDASRERATRGVTQWAR